MRMQEDIAKKIDFFISFLPESPESTDSESVIQIQIDAVFPISRMDVEKS